MRGPAAAIGHHRDRLADDRHPIGIGGVGDEDRSRREAVAFVGGVESAHRTRGDDASHGEPLDQGRALLGDREVRDRLPRPPSLHRLGPGLHDEKIPGGAVLRPLHIHRSLVVRLHGHRPAGELEDLIVVEHESVLLSLAGVDRGGGLALRHGVHDLDLFAAERAGQDRHQRRVCEERLGHPIAIAVDFALDHRLAQSPRCVDDDEIGKSGLRIEGEHHAGPSDVGTDHLLHPDRERDVEVIEAVLLAIGDGPVAEERGEAAVIGIHDSIGPRHVQVALLLTGEAGFGEVLGCRRRTDRHRQLRVASRLAHLLVGGAERRPELGTDHCVVECLT